MKWFLLTFILFVFTPLAVRAGGEQSSDQIPAPLDGRGMPVEDFLAILRYPPFIDSWAILKGTVDHKSRSRNVRAVPIELRARFRPSEWRMQVTLNNAERYLVRQIPADGLVGTTKIRQREAPADGLSLKDLMIDPSDLTLAFLYWDFDRELPDERLKTLHCRVLQLKFSDGARVRVWASTQYFFPIRVQWFKPDAEEPFRQLDFKGVTEIKSSVREGDRINMIKEATISDSGWRTRVVFDEVKGDGIGPKNPEPENLIRSD